MSGDTDNNLGDEITFLPAYKIGFLDKMNFRLNIRGQNSKGDEKDLDMVVKNLEVRGPESILAIDQKMISRINPPDGDINFEPNYFPYVDFKDLDFPWRYSNSKGFEFSKHNAVPWLCIIVLSDAEIANLKNQNVEVFSRVDNMGFLTVTSDLLPSLDELWGSAHVQLINFDRELEELEQWVEKNPNSHSSRLLCLKKLEANTQYHAFLVPSYKDSLVPYNLVPSNTMNQKSWTQNSGETVKLPVYFQWSFKTSGEGDFEFLVRKLKAGDIKGEIGTRRVDSSFTLEKEDNKKIHKHSFSREGALVSADYQGNSRPSYFDTFEEESEDKQKELIDSMNQSLQGNKSSKTIRPKPNKSTKNSSKISKTNYRKSGKPKKITDNLIKPQMAIDGILNHIYNHKINMQSQLVKLPEIPVYKEDKDEADPLVTFPVYGRYYQQTNKINKPKKENNKAKWESWIDELNSDWRYRLSASFGTKTIQNNQDTFAEQCWEQVGAIREANEKLRLAKMSYYFNKNIYNKHLTKLSNEHFAILSTPFHLLSSIKVDDKEMSVKEMLSKSGIPSGTFSVPFMKVAAQKKLKSNLYKNEELFAPYTKVNSNDSKKSNSEIGISNENQMNLSQFLSKSFGINEDIPGWKQEEIMPLVPIISLIAPMSIITTNFDESKDDNAPKNDSTIILEKVNCNFQPLIIHDMLSGQLANIIHFNNLRDINPTFDPIMAYPTVDEPMYEYLQKISMDLIVPGMDNVENNVIFLMRENRKFIESFMVGLNHEMGRELLWREFPTDQRGTIFSHFWDYGTLYKDEDGNLIPPPDIDEIHTFNGDLGTNKSTEDNPNQSSEEESDVVLVIKGDVVNRYPDMQIFALKCKTELTIDNIDNLNSSNSQIEAVILPSFRANLGKNTIIIGFPFSALDALAKEEKAEDYYFVLQEQQDLPTFGLDIDKSNSNDSENTTNNDMSWVDIQSSWLKNGYINKVNTSFATKAKEDVDSAFIASKTYQRPMRVIYSAKRLIP